LNLYERWWDDFPTGRSFSTRGLTVTETHVVNWSMLAGDWLPIHVDREYCADTPFGAPIAHGPLTMALAMGLVTQANVYGDAIIAWLGIDGLRALKPVHIGDTIHVDATVAEQAETSKDERGRVHIDYEIRNQRGEAVMVFTSGFLMKRRVLARHADA
jgi:acyl dehydratase